MSQTSFRKNYLLNNNLTIKIAQNFKNVCSIGSYLGLYGLIKMSGIKIVNIGKSARVTEGNSKRILLIKEKVYVTK